MATTISDIISGERLTTDGETFTFDGFEPTGFEGAVLHLEARGFMRSWAFEKIETSMLRARRMDSQLEWQRTYGKTSA